MTSSLLAAPLAGRQAPRVTHRPPHASEDAAVEAIELAESVGLSLDPWQQTIVRAVLAEKSDATWAATEAGFLVPRQNGKGGALEAIVLHGMFLVGDPLTLWTAHQTKTSAEAFLRIRGLIEGSEDLSRHLSRVHLAAGDEGISLRSGARLRFVARSKSSGRGFSPQRIIFDEAQELATASVAAMLFSVSAQANPQLIFAGTVPGPDNNAEHWTSVRDRGRKGGSTRLAWLEWSPKGSDDPKRAQSIDMDSRDVWAQANPALGYRLTEETIAGEREAMIADPSLFAAERLDIWPTLPEGGVGVIDAEHLSACKAEVDDVEGPVTLAVETSFDRSVSTVAIVGRRVSDGRPQVEIIDQRAGTSWVGGRVAEVCTRNDIDVIVVDGKSPAAPLVTDIEAALEVAEIGVELRVTTTADLAEACAQLVDGITAHTACVPTVDGVADRLIDDAVRGATQRTVGDGAWAWGRRTGGQGVTPLTAWTLALWAWRDLDMTDYNILDSIG